MLAYHEAVRKKGRVMLESTNHASIVPICGGNAETDLLDPVVGQFVDEASHPGLIKQMAI